MTSPSRLLRSLVAVSVLLPLGAAAEGKTGRSSKRPAQTSAAAPAPPPVPPSTVPPAPAPAAPLAPARTSDRQRLAVFDIRPLGTEAAKAELVSEIALTEASSLKGFDVIGKSDIVSMLGFERQKTILGCSDDSACLAELGGALGVDLVLVGSLGRLGAVYRLDLKLVDARRSRIRSRVGVNVEGQEEKLVGATQRAVRSLLEPGTDPSLRIAPRPSIPERVDLSAPPPPAAPPRSRALGWTAFGAGVASVGLGAFAAYEGISAKGRYSTAKGMLEGGTLKVDASAPAYAQAISDGDGSKRLAYVGAGAAVGCAVVSGVLGYISYRKYGELGPFRF